MTIPRRGSKERAITTLSSRPHLASLDGVRGLAILMVLAHELDVVDGEGSRLSHVLDVLLSSGWIGVQLFFVLSGFLITGILLDTRLGPGYLRSFFARRVLRIFPLYYATLLVAFVITPLVTSHHPDNRHQLWLWVYLSNWVSPFGWDVVTFPHFWSLAIEEQFYLVWPFVVRALPPRRLLSLAIGLSVLAFALRVALRLQGVEPTVVYMWTVCRMDALLAGGGLACLLRLPLAARWGTRAQARLGWAFLMLLPLGFLVTRGEARLTFVSQTVGYAMLTVAFTGLVLLAVTAEARAGGPLHRMLTLGPLRSLGKYSYGIYVFHSPLHVLVGEPLLSRLCPGRVPLGWALLYLVTMSSVTWGAAFVSFHLLEKRFLALKSRFVPGLAS